MEPTDDGKVTITQEYYDELRDSQVFLDCLESAGVDNWSGYDYARELYREEKEAQ